MESLPMVKKKKLVINRPGLKVVLFNLSSGDFIPEHKTNVDVVVTTISGKGVFTIGSTSHEMSSGVILEMAPHILHSIKAIEDLKFVVVHAHLSETKEKVQCGASDTSC